MQKSYKTYVQNMKKLADVEFSIALLSWDKEVNMPPKGAAFRAQQVATLSGIAHDIFTDKKFGDLLQELSEKKDTLDGVAQNNIAQSLKRYKRVNSYTTEFVVRKSEVTSATYHAWQKAREANDFNLYKDALGKMIDICREESELLGYEDHPYDALLEAYEPGCTSKELDVLFADVKRQLVDFSKAISQAPQVDNSFLLKHYGKDKQWKYGLHILKHMGYDFEAGRQDLSVHPFSTSFSPEDSRVTTRIDENNFGSMTWSCIHEGGHALYEQGLPAANYGLPSGKFISLGIHESQSRLWENNVGRGLSFWKNQYANLQQTFPENLAKIDLNTFYKAINKVVPSLIRTEADEITYHFHVLIRYEIEKLLLENKLAVKDIPEAWNSKYKAYLDIDVPDDKQGVLQDIHWALGSFGYFPTYSLGSFYAAQFYQQACKDIPDLEGQIEHGNCSGLLKWLRENIHEHGQNFSAQKLCEKITGEPLNFKYFMDYAKAKYSDIYRFG